MVIAILVLLSFYLFWLLIKRKLLNPYFSKNKLRNFVGGVKYARTLYEANDMPAIHDLLCTIEEAHEFGAKDEFDNGALNYLDMVSKSDRGLEVFLNYYAVL